MAQRPSILQFEHAFLHSKPALEVRKDGGWIWQFSGGHSKRANSAQSMDLADDENARDRLEAYADWAIGHNITPTFRATPLAGDRIIGALNKLNWRVIEEVSVMSMPVGASFTPKNDFKFLEATDPEWLDMQIALSEIDAKDVQAFTAMLTRVTVRSTGILVYDATGTAVAIAQVMVDEGIGIYINVVVRKGLRGQGYGRSVMQVALNWSKKVGAHWAAIQVVASNMPAINLYRSLGFEEIYRYHYRRPT